MGVALKRYEEAIKHYDLALQYNPSFSYAYYNKGRVLMIMGRYDEAEEEFNHSIEEVSASLSPSSLGELNKVNIGWIRIKRRDFQSANQIFTFELKNELSTSEGMLIKAILLYKQGEYPSAISLFNNIDITNFKRFQESNYSYYVAMCLWKSMKNGDEEEEYARRIVIIMEWLIQAIEIDKEWVKPYYRRAQLLSHLPSSLSILSPSGEVISSSKDDIQFVIQQNQQNAPFYQLSLPKITFLYLSSLENK